MIGQTISHDKLLEKLGEGGMGIHFYPIEPTSPSDSSKTFMEVINDSCTIGWREAKRADLGNPRRI